MRIDFTEQRRVPFVPFMVSLLLIPIFSLSTIPEKTPWHLTCPTCGQDADTNITYPFIPHQFKLGDLAPHQGAGIRIVMLDTGIAGYEFKHNREYCKHPDLNGYYDKTFGCLSAVKHTHAQDNLLNNQYKDPLCPECLPVMRRDDVRHYHSLVHGTHSYGLIASKTCGLAPQAQVIVINIFSRQGTCTMATLIQGLEKAITLQPDILLIEANMDENIPASSAPAQRMKTLLASIPWVIVPAGNNGLTKSYLSQPAGLDNVTLSVGAFGLSKDRAFIPPFSQRQAGKGPDILAPGVSITSTGIPYTQDDHATITLSGTSASAALTTAAIALMLGEFKNHVSKEELLDIIKNATVLLDDNDSWKTASLYGALDMRMALFIAHVMTNTDHKKIQAQQIRQYLLSQANQALTIKDRSKTKALCIETSCIKYIHATNQWNIKKHKKSLSNNPNKTLKQAIQNCIDHIKI